MGSTRTASGLRPVARRRLRAHTLLAAALGAGALAAPAAAPAQERQGGTVRMLWVSDTDALDPAVTYTNFGSSVALATQRPLYSYRPDDAARAVPDLAAAPPEVSADGLSVTVRLRPGVRFSPPVNREVTSHDVKYAVERGFFSSVATPYAGFYFADIAGARPDVAPGTQIPGIETPDDRTVVFRLSQPRAGTLVAAMVMPLTAPVPREYAARFDARRRSTYGEHQVATGPYRIRADASGRAVGHRPDRRLHLVRNPSWDRATDFRTAGVDEIDIRMGNEDTAAATRRILRGRRLLSGDWPAPLGDLRRELRARRGQFAFVNAGSVNFIPLNTERAPFDDADVRRAVVAGFDRRAALRLIGGALGGTVATHFIPPSVPGFEEAGGREGPPLDFVADHDGSLRRAARYLRRAGYRSGRFTGRQRIEVVTTSDDFGRDHGRLTRRQLERLGFRVRVRAVTYNRMLELCSTGRAHACPLFGWIRDFPDAQSVLDPVFNGRNILPGTANSNIARLDVPAINDAMEAAKAVIDPVARTQAWAAIDRQITAQAPGVPLHWPRSASVRSRDVRAQISQAQGLWDLSHVALR